VDQETHPNDSIHGYPIVLRMATILADQRTWEVHRLLTLVDLPTQDMQVAVLINNKASIQEDLIILVAQAGLVAVDIHHKDSIRMQVSIVDDKCR